MSDISDEADDGGIDRVDNPMPLGGVATRDDRYFLYRAISAMSTSGLPLATLVDRMSEALGSSLERSNPVSLRRKGYVDGLKAEIAKGPSADTPLYRLFDPRRFVFTAEERCLLSLSMGEAPPAVLSTILAAAAEFVSAGPGR